MRFSLQMRIFGLFAFFVLLAFAVGQGVITIALLGILWVLIFFVVRQDILLPLRQLRQTFEKVERGDWGALAFVGRTNEIQDVFAEFNEMARGLQEGKVRDTQVSRMKSEFLSITAHQLRTPLSALKWVLRMVLDGDTGPLRKAQKELLERGYDSNERMINLVNDLLDVVRIEEGRFEYTFKKGAVVSILENIVRETAIVADKREIQLSFHKPSRMPPKVLLDEAKFRLAAMNIVENAIRYTPARGQIDVEVTLHDNDILVSVRDTGIGIPKDQIGRVFTKFFRGENAIRVQPAGSGLGLFIAKNIIEKHGGTIWIESEEGKRTDVYFTIPLNKN